MRFSDRDSLINQQLNNVEMEFRKFIILNETKLSEFSAKDIRDLVMGIKRGKKNISIADFISSYYDSIISPNQSLTKGSKKNYKKAINHLTKFIAFKNIKNILLKDIDNHFANGFKDYLIADHARVLKKAMTEVSASANIIKLRTIFDRAVNENLLAKNPFKSLKLKTRSPHRARLNIVQLKQILDLDLSRWPNLFIYRDIFLFSIYTGLAFQDLVNLSRNNLTFYEDGEVLLTINRQKTDIITEQYLVHQAIDICKRASVLPEVRIANSLLPKRSNKELNLKIKIIGALSDIQIRLSSHIGRHSFRQLLGEAGVEDWGVIKRMMGQTTRGDVDSVYYTITKSRLLAAKNKFENYLKINFIC
jgi:integrase